MPINYIYQISCRDDTIKDSYIGSTCDIVRRGRQHKTKCHNERSPHHQLRVYQCIRANGGWINWTVTVLEEFQCESKMEKTKKERSFIEQLQPTLNVRMPSNHQTGDQYDRKEYRTAYHETYYNNNRQQILENKRMYYVQHIEEIKAYDKARYIKNKEARNIKP